MAKILYPPLTADTLFENVMADAQLYPSEPIIELTSEYAANRLAYVAARIMHGNHDKKLDALEDAYAGAAFDVFEKAINRLKIYEKTKEKYRNVVLDELNNPSWVGLQISMTQKLDTFLVQYVQRNITPDTIAEVTEDQLGLSRAPMDPKPSSESAQEEIQRRIARLFYEAHEGSINNEKFKHYALARGLLIDLLPGRMLPASIEYKEIPMPPESRPATGAAPVTRQSAPTSPEAAFLTALEISQPSVLNRNRRHKNKGSWVAAGVTGVAIGVAGALIGPPLYGEFNKNALGGSGNGDAKVQKEPNKKSKARPGTMRDWVERNTPPDTDIKR